SWLSREVIVLPAFMALVLCWALLQWFDLRAHIVAVGTVAVLLALFLYVCTGMIYAAVKAMAQWAHPITPINFLVLGLASGLTLAASLAAWLAPSWVPLLSAAALVVTLTGLATRAFSLRRNLTLVAKTNLQTAIGIRHPNIQQKAQGAMGGSFNTREFFHGKDESRVRQIRWFGAIAGFFVPMIALVFGVTSAVGLSILFLLQYFGLLAERWSFFAEAQHPQNLYYRSIS
ncbi:MAG: dimethyl sulfoxide reductase anchor subunit family protein, partial [Casimicrobium sp.]